MTLVWDLPLPIARKMLLLSLADQANDSGQCWPELDDLAARCSMSRRTLFDCLRELEEVGLLSRIHRGTAGALRVIFQVHESALRQQDLLAEPGEKFAPVRNLHRCKFRTGAKNSGDPVRNLHPIKQPKRSNPKGISPGASGRLNEPSGDSGEFVQPPDRVGAFEGHATSQPGPGTPTAAGAIAVALRERGFRITSQAPDLLAAVEEGVTLATVIEFAELYPSDHHKCRGSPGYVLSAARRQQAEQGTTTATVSRGTRGASNGKRRESDADRIARLGRELDAREAAAADG